MIQEGESNMKKSIIIAMCISMIIMTAGCSPNKIIISTTTDDGEQKTVVLNEEESKEGNVV